MSTYDLRRRAAARGRGLRRSPGCERTSRATSRGGRRSSRSTAGRDGRRRGRHVRRRTSRSACSAQARCTTSRGRTRIDSFSELLGSLDLFPDAAPSVDGWRHYRRWAFESAALDLALRQAGATLADALGLEPRPVSFVVSMRLGEPPAIERVLDLLDALSGDALQARPDERLGRGARRASLPASAPWRPST